MSLSRNPLSRLLIFQDELFILCASRNRDSGLFVQEWCQTLIIQGFASVCIALFVAWINPADGVAYALGAGITWLAYAVSACTHFRVEQAPSAHAVFRRAGQAIVLRFFILIVGVMVTIRYFGSVNHLFFIVGLVITQLCGFGVPLWRACKGKD